MKIAAWMLAGTMVCAAGVCAQKKAEPAQAMSEAAPASADAAEGGGAPANVARAVSAQAQARAKAKAHSKSAALDRLKTAPLDRLKTAPLDRLKTAPLDPLSPRDRVVQMLDRFTYGARPGEVDRVLEQGADRWLEQQLNPAAIRDAAVDRKLADFPTVSMPAAQAMMVFPANQQVRAVAEGLRPMPTDPTMKAVYEVLVAKWNERLPQKKADGTEVPPAAPTDEDLAAKKAQAKADAARVAGVLLGLPKEQRLSALLAMPVADRIALTEQGNLTPEQRQMLGAGFTPREREVLFAMAGNPGSSYRLHEELAQARMMRDVLSERQLEQVMTNFWFNHFNIYMQKDSDQWYTASYERDVIRKNALGKFKDLLMATAGSPAMMVYLDNWQSIGPDSLANGVNPAFPKAKRGNRGLNENYGREIMELHTVGVNGGYTQADVTALSAILTGWTVDQPFMGGGFRFEPRRHEPGPKYWFGYRIEEDGTATKVNGPMPAQTFGPSDQRATIDSVKQGMKAIEILAASPQTAHFISWKLAQYFVADKPPAALVDRLAGVYMATGGDIKELVRAIAHSPEFNSHEYFHNKVKTPEEFVASAYRVTGTTPDNPAAMSNTVREMGEPLYLALPPTGYYLTAEQWMSSKALIDRLNFAYALTNGRYAGQRFDAPRLLAEGLMAPGGEEELATVRAAAAAPVARAGARSKLIGWENGAAKPTPPAHSAGAETTVRLLESTILGRAASAETDRLIAQQVSEQPETASTVDKLNLAAALMLGSPEFQSR